MPSVFDTVKTHLTTCSANRSSTALSVFIGVFRGSIPFRVMVTWEVLLKA